MFFRNFLSLALIATSLAPGAFAQVSPAVDPYAFIKDFKLVSATAGNGEVYVVVDVAQPYTGTPQFKLVSSGFCGMSAPARCSALLTRTDYGTPADANTRQMRAVFLEEGKDYRCVGEEMVLDLIGPNTTLSIPVLCRR